MHPRLATLKNDFPRQFWFLFIGVLISATGSSMIWPFLMIYVTEKLKIPMAGGATLLAINSITGLCAILVAGPIFDRFGRKRIMIMSLVCNALAYLFLNYADTYITIAIAMAIAGIFNPLYPVGADAMVADLFPSQRRPAAYSILRMSQNIGVAIGPVVGGLAAVHSYAIAFYLAALSMIVYSLILIIFTGETLTRSTEAVDTNILKDYSPILSDRQFLPFFGAMTLTTICVSFIWIILPVYAKHNFNIPENVYGFLPMTNALMVVFLQVAVTSQTRKHLPLHVLTLGSLFYALGVGYVAFASNFGGFFASMVTISIGELMLVPTAATYTASLAAPETRGRYMSVLNLAWRISMGVGPVVGGIISTYISGQATWIGGCLIGLVSTLWFIFLSRRTPKSLKQFSASQTSGQPC
jgi:MFS family permease